MVEYSKVNIKLSYSQLNKVTRVMCVAATQDPDLYIFPSQP